MAMVPTLIKFLQDKKEEFPIQGRLLTIGYQAVFLNLHQFKEIFSKDLAGISVEQEELFCTLGAKQVDTLDYHGTAGATIRCDLNDLFQEDKYKALYDIIFDGGTMEHIFNTDKFLKNMDYFLKVGGTIIHVNPCQGYFNHGFYLFQPTFYYDFYKNNGYTDCKCYLLDFNGQDKYSYSGQPKIHHLKTLPNLEYRTLNDTLIIFKAKKGTEKTKINIPIQSIYSITGELK